MALHSISDTAAFNQEVQSAQGPVLVDFWAQWCGPCKALTPNLEALSERYPDVRFLKINADDPVGQDLGAAYGVASLPTLLLLKGGKLINKMTGNVSTTMLKDFVESGL